MDYEKYIKDATRTESVVDEVSVSQDLLVDSIKLFILSAQRIDLLKRKIFYNKDITESQISELSGEIQALSKKEHNLSEVDSVEVNARILHASLGFATEAGEILEALMESLNGKAFDEVNFMEELGDMNWYQAIALDETKLNFEQILKKNIEKLKKRFPEKFSEEKAIKRDLVSERKALESNSDND